LLIPYQERSGKSCRRPSGSHEVILGVLFINEEMMQYSKNVGVSSKILKMI